jgi:hypothetical protein
MVSQTNLPQNMRFKIFNAILLVIIFSLKLHGQQPEYLISAIDDSISFYDFVDEVENNTGLSFYFLQEWVAGIKVAHSDITMPLSGILKGILQSTGLHFYIENNDIFIYPGDSLQTKLPLFRHAAPGVERPEKVSDNITETERSYIEARINDTVEVITVGNKKDTRNERCAVSVTILNKSNGEPLIGATVYVEDLQMGAVTDAEGQLRLSLMPGRYKSIFNYIGMEQQTRYLRVYSGGSFTLEMGEEPIKISEVTISANRHDNVKGMQMGYERLTSRTLKEIPVVMGEKDILKVAQMLPGVQVVGEGSSGFNVRGSPADQNMFYVDGVPVYNTSHLFGFFTSFNPDIINDFSLYKSNIPARYGGRLASVFDISTRTGNKKKFFGQGGISPVTGHFSIEGPVKKNLFNNEAGKTSFVASYRSTYSDWILRRINDEDLRNSSASFYDVSLAVNSEINNKNLLKLFGYNSRDRFSLSSKNDYDYSNSGGSVIWKHLFSRTLTGDFSLLFSRYSFGTTDKNNVSEAYHYNYEIDHYETKADFLYQTESKHRIEFGGSSVYYDLNRGKITPFGEESLRVTSLLGRERGVENAIYLSDEFKLFTRLGLLAGLRYSFYFQLGPDVVNEYLPGTAKLKDNIKDIHTYKNGQIIQFYSGPEFRGALNYQLGRNQSLKASYNRLRQYIFMLSNTVAISPTDQWKLTDFNIRPPVVDQISLGFYQDNSKRTVSASLEAYRKWIHHIVEYRDGADFLSSEPVEQQILQGNQDTWGIEFMLRKSTGKLSGWLSYTYSRSLVQVDGSLEENRINGGRIYPSNYDRPHNLSIVANSRLNRRLSFSANLVYITGRPITYPVSVYYLEGHQVLNFSDRNKYRIPDYLRADLSINLEGNLLNKKIAHSYWMLNFYNLLGRKNAYSVYYTVEDGNIKGFKLSIFAQPVITLSWHFKFGNYLSE